MKIRCAWHKQNFGYELVMGEKEPLADKRVSDGICDDCLKLFRKDWAPVIEVLPASIETERVLPPTTVCPHCSTLIEVTPVTLHTTIIPAQPRHGLKTATRAGRGTEDVEVNLAADSLADLCDGRHP